MKTLQEIYNKYSMNDCGGDKGTQHSYIEIYEDIFNQKSRENIKLLEIGIYQGHSLMMWSEYFSNSKIVGVDIDLKQITFKFTNEVTLVEGDIINSRSLNRFLDGFGEFDYIIDDGSHLLQDQIQAYHILSKNLKHDGVYIIEDISDINSSEKYFKNLSRSVEIFDLRQKKGRYDDVLAVIRK